MIMLKIVLVIIKLRSSPTLAKIIILLGGCTLRIVSLCPSNTELLIYLGLEQQLVGIDDYSDWPASIQELPKVGPDLSIDIEKVKSLKPDLVVASLSVPGMEKNIENLKREQLNFIVLNPQSLDDIAEDLNTLGKATGTEDRAQKLKNTYLPIIHDYRKLSETVTHPPTLYWEWWPKPVFTPGGVNWLTEISRLSGGINIFADHPIANVQTTWDDILNKNPDTICMVWVGVDFHKVKPEFVLKRENSNQVNTVKKGNIHILEEALYCRPSPRLLMGMKKLAALLHPDIYPPFEGTDPLANFYTK